MAQQKWEYKIVEGAQESAERLVNENAAKGWEVDQMSCVLGPRDIALIVIIMRRPVEG